MVTRDSPECRAFRRHFNDLVVSLTPSVSGISTQLFSEELVDQETFGYALTIGLPNNEKIVRVLNFIQTSIGREPGKFATFVDVLRTNAELRAIADTLVGCRDKIISDRERDSSRHASTMRSAGAVPSSPLVQLRPLGERSFPSPAGSISTPSTRTHHFLGTPIVRPADLPIIENKKKHSIPSPPSFTHPVPCTDRNEKDTDARPSAAVAEDQVSLQKELVECKCEFRKLEDDLRALRIEDDRKLSEKDRTVNMLTLIVQDLRAEREYERAEHNRLIQEWQEYTQHLVREVETAKQDCVLLEEKVAYFEDDRKRAEQVHQMELDHVKKQLQAEVDDKKEFLAQLETHHQRAALNGRKTRSCRLLRDGRHSL